MLRYRGLIPAGSDMEKATIDVNPLQGTYNGIRVHRIIYQLRNQPSDLVTFGIWGGRKQPVDIDDLEAGFFNDLYGIFITGTSGYLEGMGLEISDTLVVLGGKFDIYAWTMSSNLPACWFEIEYEQVRFSDENVVTLMRKGGIDMDFNYGMYPEGQG